MPPILPVTLPQDSGHQYIDRNAFHVPKHPFEPAFQAMLNMSPNVRFDDIDIIVNRNSLRKLLDFASGKRQDPFRMDLNMVKDTLFISRRERKARQIIHGTPNAGYGHNLEKAFTKPDNELEDSGSHHRVIRYHLGHLNCVVRFEVDAYYDSTDEPNTESPSLATVDDITASVAQLTMKKQQPVPLGKASTQVIVKGTPIHSSKLAEIKARKTVKINECMPQLWFGRTPYLLTGLHTGGVFCSVNYSHIGPQFLDWEIANQERLRKLVSLLAEIRRVVGETKSGAAALVCEKKGANIQILKTKNDMSVLPKEIQIQYWS